MLASSRLGDPRSSALLNQIFSPKDDHLDLAAVAGLSVRAQPLVARRLVQFADPRGDALVGARASTRRILANRAVPHDHRRTSIYRRNYGHDPISATPSETPVEDVMPTRELGVPPTYPATPPPDEDPYDPEPIKVPPPKPQPPAPPAQVGLGLETPPVTNETPIADRIENTLLDGIDWAKGVALGKIDEMVAEKHAAQDMELYNDGPMVEELDGEIQMQPLHELEDSSRLQIEGSRQLQIEEAERQHEIERYRREQLQLEMSVREAERQWFQQLEHNRQLRERDLLLAEAQQELQIERRAEVPMDIARDLPELPELPAPPTQLALPAGPFVPPDLTKTVARRRTVEVPNSTGPLVPIRKRGREAFDHDHLTVRKRRPSPEQQVVPVIQDPSNPWSQIEAPLGDPRTSGPAGLPPPPPPVSSEWAESSGSRIETLSARNGRRSSLVPVKVERRSSLAPVKVERRSSSSSSSSSSSIHDTHEHQLILREAAAWGGTTNSGDLVSRGRWGSR